MEVRIRIRNEATGKIGKLKKRDGMDGDSLKEILTLPPRLTTFAGYGGILGARGRNKNGGCNAYCHRLRRNIVITIAITKIIINMNQS